MRSRRLKKRKKIPGIAARYLRRPKLGCGPLSQDVEANAVNIDAFEDCDIDPLVGH